jgi:hypothetical protein
LDDLITDADARRALLHVQQRLRDGVEKAGRAFSDLIPAATGQAAYFDIMQRDAAAAMLELNTRVMQGLTEQVRETVRTYVADALAGGKSVPGAVKGIRDVIGLAPNQVRAVENFRRMLEEGDTEALTRALRDRRFDATIRKAFAGDGLTPAQIDRMVDAYRRRFIAFNTDVQLRTAANDAQRLAQHLAWGQAVERGEVDGDSLMKTWSGSLDDRERPGHLAMEGETVKWDQPFSNGQQIPGDTEYGCRCIARYRQNVPSRMGAGAAAGLFPDQPISDPATTRAQELAKLRAAARARRKGAA